MSTTPHLPPVRGRYAGGDTLRVLGPRARAPLDTSPGLTLDTAGLTDRGRQRESNQDQFLVARINRSIEVDGTSLPGDVPRRLIGRCQPTLLAVADGAGGHPGGDVASAVAIDSLVEHVLLSAASPRRDDRRAMDVTAGDLREAVARAELRVQDVSERKGWTRSGAVTTLTLAIIAHRRCYVAHAGDSRCYLLRGTELAQLTRDHTVAQQLADSEGIASGQWALAMQHVLHNAVGGTEPVEVELRYADLEPGDVVLLCTDGLTRHVDDGELVSILRANRTAEASCRALIAAANAAGGADNVTAVVARA